MKLSEIYKIADAIAPKRLSDEYCRTAGAYDNSGLLVEACEEVTGILFSLDLTNAAIDEAIANGANLIITHHPVIYGKIDHICVNDPLILGEKLVRCIREGISVISMHLNLDVAKDGIDESLMQGILLASGETDGAGTRSISIQHPVEESGYGRVYDVKSVALGTLAEGMKKVFSTDRIVVYGDQETSVTRVASFCGAGADEGAIVFAKKMGAQVMVSSDFKHHLIQLLTESGIAVIVLTHYASEQYGFEKYYKKIRQQVEIPCIYHTENNLF
ncbi:MAG: Nif3-like dinuclear metal center hexameric protein [Clostridia bacterium]|nr:Nif3-like dinuclear metal center hexameric protein [Clostridia bacterium]